MTGFINRPKYETILTEDIPGSNQQMCFITDKHSFQLTGTNKDTYTLSNIVGYNQNETILSMVDNWVGIGTFYPKERLQVYGNVMAFSFKASGGDYSEWELLEENEAIPEPGTVIGFNDQGKITSKWSKSKCFGIVSNKPSIIGNQDLYDAHPDQTKVPVVYIGKIVLNLKDEGNAGDLIYPVQNNNDKIRLKIFPTQKPFAQPIGYIRRKIKEHLYEVIVRI